MRFPARHPPGFDPSLLWDMMAGVSHGLRPSTNRCTKRSLLPVVERHDWHQFQHLRRSSVAVLKERHAKLAVLHAPNSLVGQVNQRSLFVAHAFDRYAQRIIKQRVTRTEALRMFSEASLAAESKALIEDGKGGAIYVIKTKETCMYFFGYVRIRDQEIYRFFKTIIDESMLRNYQRKYLTALNATFDTWSNEAISWGGRKKLPIVGRQ